MSGSKNEEALWADYTAAINAFDQQSTELNFARALRTFREWCDEFSPPTAPEATACLRALLAPRLSGG